MIKLMVLLKTKAQVSDQAFSESWRDFFHDFHALDSVRAHLQKAVHHHVLPGDIRHDQKIAESRWAGLGNYYLSSRVAAQAVLDDPAYQRLQQSAEFVTEMIHLLVEEVWIHNRDRSVLPIKMFAFFKRLPSFSRLQALQYYQGPHAQLGDQVNKGRTVRYIQNHVLLDYQNESERYNFDGGPEIWFKNMDIALDLFSDQEAMATLSEDEARFVIRDDLIHFLTDEQLVYEREAIA